MPLEQQFLSFLISQIENRAQVIAKQTQNETASFAANELQIHISELKKAVGTLFDTMPTKPARGKRGADA